VVKGSTSQIAVVRYVGGVKLKIVASEQNTALSESENAGWQEKNPKTEDTYPMVEEEDQRKVGNRADS